MKTRLGIVTYNKYRAAVVYYIISLFMLANGNLFSFILKSIHLSIWRQLIFAVGICILLFFRNSYIKTYYYRILKTYFFLALIISIFAIITDIIHRFSIIRLGFAFWGYFCGVPFILFPYIFRRYMNNKNAIKFYNIFIILGVFSTLGLFLDYCLGGAITQFFFLFNENLDDYSFENIGRYYFLTESPTSFGLFYCFCLICVFFRIYFEKKTSRKIIFFIIALSFLFGGWLTGSRQILLALLIELTVCGVFYLFHTKDNKTYLILALVLGIAILPSILSNMFSANENLSERFSSSTIKEDKRSLVWKRSFEETCLEMDVLLFGKAFGYTVLNNVGEGEDIGYHYENTFFARISETGLVGLLIFLYPFIIILSKMRRIDFFKSLILGFAISFLIVSFISPNGTHQTSQMVLFIALGMILDKDYFSMKGQLGK